MAAGLMVVMVMSTKGQWVGLVQVHPSILPIHSITVCYTQCVLYCVLNSVLRSTPSPERSQS